MSNIFIRTSIAPYRIDTYNAIHDRLGMEMCFYDRYSADQPFDVAQLESRCLFKPIFLNGITFKNKNRKWCFGLWHLLLKEKPKLVIVPEFQIVAFQVLFFRWLTRAHYKVISMTDDSIDMIVNKNDFSTVHGWLRRHFPKLVDDLIVVTPKVEDWYQKHYGKGIWLPILMNEEKTMPYYERLLPLGRNLLKRYGLENKCIVISVNRLIKVKNLHRLIDAFAMIQNDASLVIIGDGPERESLERHASNVNKEILFPGRFDGDELYAWYNIARVLVLASVQEAFGAVTNEALLAGCRVVVSERAGSSCLVNDRNGSIVNPYDVLSIANAIDFQINNTRQPDLIKIRYSLMNVSFNERINNLVNKII